MKPTRLLFMLLCALGGAACDDPATEVDLAVPEDLQLSVDMNVGVPCMKVTTWRSNGSATFRPLDHEGLDVASAHASMSYAGGDGGADHLDDLKIEIRLSPGATPSYPRSVTLPASTTYATCTECLTISRDLVLGKPTQRFLARSGNLLLERVDQAKVGSIEVSGTTLRFEEWSDSDAPVPDGACYEVGSFSFALPYTQGPVTTNDM